jgi:hypothetical protein
MVGRSRQRKVAQLREEIVCGEDCGEIFRSWVAFWRDVSELSVDIWLVRFCQASWDTGLAVA